MGNLHRWFRRSDREKSSSLALFGHRSPVGPARSGRRPFSAAALLLALACSGCGGDDLNPAGPQGPNLKTVQGALVALEEYYGLQKASNAIALLGNTYHYIPARPEDVPFLGPTDTSWPIKVEKDILGTLLDPEKVSWIDQVLLEITVQEITTTTEGLKIVDAVVELGILVGADEWEKGKAPMRLTYGVDAEGNHLLLEERELLPDDYNSQSVLVTDQKIRILPEGYTP